MKQIVVLGGGFAGVAAIHALQKKLSLKEGAITLIDKNPYHLFTPSLYEVATSEEPKGNIAIPYKEIFGKKVEIIQGEVEKIDTKKKTVAYRLRKPSTSSGKKDSGQARMTGYNSSLSEQSESKGLQTIMYDYLLIALGSEPAYFHIPGLKENSIALKSLREAVEIKNKIQNMCCKEGKCNKKVQVVIGGGGFSGTELAAELLTYKDKIARQHHLDPQCLEITIIQGSDRLLKELDPHVSKIAEKRLHEPNVRFAFGGHITKVTTSSIFTDNNTVFLYDIFIWTGGVQANAIAWKSNLPINKRGQIIVNNFLQVQGSDTIFAAGDIAEFIDERSKTPAPTVAQVAEEEGKKVAENIINHMQQRKLFPYIYRHFGYIVPLRGKYAVAELMGNFHFDGFIGWILQQLVFLRYLFGILPIIKTLKTWSNFEIELRQ